MKRAPLSLKARALAWLAQREHSRDELRRKLIRAALAPAHPRRRSLDGNLATSDDADAPRGAEPIEDAAPQDREVRAAEVEALLDDLEAHGWLSARRFVESRVDARAPRFGARRIAQELAQHGLALDAETAAALMSSEDARARAVWQRRYGRVGDDAGPSDAAERARQGRFLLARGFSPDTVRRVLRARAGGSDDD